MSAPIKHSRFELEWWVFSKRYLYSSVTFGLLALLVGGAALYVYLYGNPFGTHTVGASVVSGARFVSFDGEVRVVRARTRETITARADTQLYPGDTVQTQADGRALIMMADGSTCLVRANSVVIIRDNTTVENGARANVRVAVDRGQINVRTQEQAEGTSNVVETKQTENKLAQQTGASFGIRDDGTEDIGVATGLITTTTRSGDKTSVRGGEYVSINQNGNVRTREGLLAPPIPVSPRDLERISASAQTNAAEVTLRWQRPSTGVSIRYHVEVATSPFFVAAGQVFARDQLDATQLNIGALKLGTYFWRVRAVAASGQMSEWSEPLKFIIAPGGTGERVAVSDVTYDYVAGDIYLVRGKSPPGTTIKVAGRQTLAMNDGTFQIQISVPKFARQLTFDAEDPQGNRSSYRLPFSPAAQQ